jgi:hypothetical protein
MDVAPIQELYRYNPSVDSQIPQLIDTSNPAIS